jgi:hypothetical protein
MTRNLFLMIAVALSLSACGGGSSGALAADSGTPTPASGAAPASSSGPASVASTYTPAGNAASVEGVDSANRGYRDDVQQLIDDKFSGEPAIHASAEVAARNFQTSIKAATLAMTDTSPVVIASGQLAWCAANTVPLSEAADDETATQAVYARTFNTDARMAARQTYLAKATSVGVITYDPTKCQASVGGQ